MSTFLTKDDKHQGTFAMTINKKRLIYQITIFTLLVNTLAWLGPILGGTPSKPGLGLLLWGTAPMLSALIMKVLLRDQVPLGFRPLFRGNGYWYALSFLLYPVAIAILLGIGLLSGTSKLNNFTVATFATAMVPLSMTYFVFAFFEEVGWRGYLAPRVYSLNRGLLGHIVVGLIWASWHLPYLRELWAHTSEGLETLLPRFVIGTIVSAIVYGEIRMRTNSVWPAVLMHWLGNTIANTLLTGFIVLVPGREWFSSFGVEGLLMMLIFGLIGSYLYLQRNLGRHATPMITAEQHL